MSRVTKKSSKEIVNWSVKLLHRKDPNLASKNMWRKCCATPAVGGNTPFSKSALAKPMATTPQHTTKTHRVSPHVELFFVLSLDTCGSAFMLNFTKRCPDACDDHQRQRDESQGLNVKLNKKLSRRKSMWNTDEKNFISETSFWQSHPNSKALIEIPKHDILLSKLVYRPM